MKKAGLYIRVSTLEQAQEGYSIGAQKERLIAFCKAHDWTIADIYVDGGYTGSNLDRPGMQKLISEINKMAFEYRKSFALKIGNYGGTNCELKF